MAGVGPTANSNSKVQRVKKAPWVCTLGIFKGSQVHPSCFEKSPFWRWSNFSQLYECQFIHSLYIIYICIAKFYDSLYKLVSNVHLCKLGHVWYWRYISGKLMWQPPTLRITRDLRSSPFPSRTTRYASPSGRLSRK